MLSHTSSSTGNMQPPRRFTCPLMVSCTGVGNRKADSYRLVNFRTIYLTRDCTVTATPRDVVVHSVTTICTPIVLTISQNGPRRISINPEIDLPQHPRGRGFAVQRGEYVCSALSIQMNVSAIYHNALRPNITPSCSPRTLSTSTLHDYWRSMKSPFFCSPHACHMPEPTWYD